VDATGDDFSVLVTVAGKMLNGRDMGVDTIQVFVDSDRTATTGYLVHGVGAEHLIEVTGWDGDVHTASMESWNEGSSGNDLMGFEAQGSVEASAAGPSLELKVMTISLGMKNDDTPVRVLVRSADAKGSEDWTDTAVNQVGPALEVRQLQDGVNLSLDMVAHNRDVTLRSMKVHYLGEGAEGRATAIVPGGQVEGTIGGTSTLQFEPPLEIAANIGTTVRIENEFRAGTAVLPLLSSGDDLTVDGRAETYVAPLSNWTSVQVEPVPELDVRIDGNFDDWYAIGLPSTDPGGDVVAVEDGWGVTNPDVDIRGFHTLLTPVVQAPTHLSSYVRVDGEMLGGMLVEHPLRPGPPGPPGPSGPPAQPPDHLYLEDRTIIYIDIDPVGDLTGYRVAPGVGAEFKIEVSGKMGRLIPGGAKLLAYVEGVGEWQSVTDEDVHVGLDRDELEVQVDLGLLQGVDTNGTLRTFFVSTDWAGNRDDAFKETRSSENHLTVWEYPAEQNQKVWKGDTDVPVLRILVENNAPSVANLLNLRAGLFGTLGSAHIPAVRIWAADGEQAVFDAEDAKPVAEGGGWDGDVILLILGAAEPITPGQRVTLFVTVDIDETAPTMSWFDLIVVHDRGLETTMPLLVEVDHAPYRFIRVWEESYGRALPNHIVINEIRSDDTWDYLEVYNPSSTEQNVKDWYADMEHNTETDYTIITFSDTDVSATSIYAEGLDTEVSYDESGWSVTLYNATDAKIDRIPMPGTWVSNGKSWCRYKDASGDPYYSAEAASGDWYTSSSPSLGSANDQTIPEFEEIVVPVLATLAIVTVLRRNNSRRRGKA
jgi:hypothetical protein